MIDAAVVELTPIVGAKAACDAVGRSRASHYRAHPVRPVPLGPAAAPAPRKRQPRALTAAEQAAVLDVLHSERFVDAAPEAVYATLLDEGVYLCSIPTMYRLLRARGETGDRRRHATHPAHVKPELVATQPNSVWSWDIAYVSTWSGWVYVAFVTDAYARRILGWRAGTTMSTQLVLDVLEQAIWTRGRAGSDLESVVAHSDRGSQYTAIKYGERLAYAGIAASVGSIGDSYDNALAETINGYKTELIKPWGPRKTADEVEYGTPEWVDWFTAAASTNTAATSHPQSWRPPTTLRTASRRRRRSHTSESPDMPGRFTIHLWGQDGYGKLSVCLLSTPKMTSSVVAASTCATSPASRFAIAKSPA